MAAGSSAGVEAARARAAASKLERKARYASKVADDYAKGAAGEEMVAAALEPLVASGWRILHDLAAPDGGNIDHIAVGPPGVAVIDAKNWASPVTVTPDRRLVASKYDHTPALVRLTALSDQVRTLAAHDGLNVAVRGYLVLAGDVDRDRASVDVGDLRVLGIDRLADRLGKQRGDLAPDLVDVLARTIELTFPPAQAGGRPAPRSRPAPPARPNPPAGPAAAVRRPAPPVPAAPTRAVDRSRPDLAHLPPPPVGYAESAGPAAGAIPATAVGEDTVPSPLFERAHRFYYLRSWKKGGHHRLYLSARDGTSLGWTDVNTGAMNLEGDGDDRKLAEALLAAADPTGMKLAPGDLPKVATRLWGGRLLSKVARFHTSVLVGQEWRAFGKHRLYGTLIDPTVDTFDLGWIDLKTGERHSSIEGDLAKDRGPADRYLAYLHHHLPKR